ncbi:YncE family protein [Sulfuriflexus mobilis]|uniref:YncE family protein n=1 Tax=Sulfuriflexus mobilis TaxID=1811807 RepID=UPI000F83F55E|nr:YncE family protein [Sulfuriflexus mobilis]
MYSIKLNILGMSLLAIAGSALAGTTVYIPLGSGNQVIAVDAEKDTITATYSGVENPHGLVATPDGEYLIAGSLKETALKAGEAKDTPNSKLFLIHPVHGHVMSTIAVSGWTHHQAITPDGRYVISTHPIRGNISVVDMQTSQVVKTIKTGPAPNYTLVTRDGKKAFVSNSGNGTISEIDISSWKVMRTLKSGPSPEHLTFSADEKTIYVTNPRAGSVSAISVDSGDITKSYTIGKNVHGLDISDDGKKLFVTSTKEDKLVAIDLSSGELRSIKLSPAPYHLNTIRGTGKVYISSRKLPIIWVMNQKNLEVLGKINLPGGEAHQMTVVKD